MNAHKVIRHGSSAAIAAVPAFVLIALISALFMSIAPDEPASSAASPANPNTVETTPPSEPGPSDSASILHEKTDYGAREAARRFFQLLDEEIIYRTPADFVPIVTGTCEAERCWKRFQEQDDLRTGPEDIQIGGYHFLHVNYIVRVDSDKAYLMGELTLSEGYLLRPDQEVNSFEEKNLGEITIGLEYTDTGWKVSDVSLDDPPSATPRDT
ncbi:hypothetical protein ACLQ8T_09960 [Glutamicibacter sp. FR1]|uniref:hypothetical protein n=1 Tax=Glutamicibacter sp. FR1 TaxID=3393744 RepID=UPI0039AFB35D